MSRPNQGAAFNLENYETVKERKKRFYEKYADGRIVVEAISVDSNSALFKATIFKTAEDQAKNLPLSTGYAQEFKGQGGFANKFSWCENCEESAIGRALDNAGYSGNDKCSREEMIKVKYAEESHKDASLPKKQSGDMVTQVKDGVTISTHKDQIALENKLATYTIPFGRKFKGKKFDECSVDELLSYADWLTKNTNGPISSQVKEFQSLLDLYVKSNTPDTEQDNGWVEESEKDLGPWNNPSRPWE